MDLTQSVLLSVIVVVTIFLVFIGFQAFFTLKELRKTLGKINQLVEDTDKIAQEVKKPVESVGHLFTAIVTGAGIANLLKRKGINRHE